MFFYMSNSSPFVRIYLQKISISKRLKQKTCQKNMKENTKENTKGAISLQTDHSFSVILHKSIQICKRISFCLFSLCEKAFGSCEDMKKKTKAASMTLEAALVLPLFLFAVMNLMSFIEIYRLQSNMNMKLHQAAKQMAVTAATLDSLGGDECIDFIYPYQANPFVAMVGFEEFTMFSRMRTRAWTGFDNESASEVESEEIVYVTQYGEVYHRSKSCSYLKVSIRGVSLALIEELRNAEGACYYACEKCGSNCMNTVFVTAYGNRYHSTLQCSGLKRTIQEIPLSQVGEKEACKKCG